jgi:hypothetical protein
VGEHIKLLDLTAKRRGLGRGSTDDDSSPAVLFDTLSLRYVPTGPKKIELRYATTGTALRGRSLSHPNEAQWLAPADNGRRGGEWRRPGLSRVMRIPLRVGDEESQVIQNCVEYVGAFSSPDQQWFHTRVIYPTDSLTLLVRFPAQRPFRALHGLCRRRTDGALRPAAEQPVGIWPGRLAYWRIAAPAPGESYQLGWT